MDTTRRNKIFFYGSHTLEFTLAGHGQLRTKTESFGLKEKNILFACACRFMSLPDGVNSYFVRDTTRQYTVVSVQFHFECLQYSILHCILNMKS